MPRGRPRGSLAAVSRPHQVQVRLTEDERGWLAARAQDQGGTESDVLRTLIDHARRGEMYETTIEGTTVRYWDVYRQQWRTCDAADVPDRDLAAMPEEDREVVLRLRG